MRATDDDGVMPVIEAILVALLVLTAILFVTGVQRPLKGSEASGVDLARLAGQTMGLLKQQTFTGAEGPLDFEGAINATMVGDADVSEQVAEFLKDVLPPGARYELGLANAYSTLRLLPVADPGTPSNARWAEIPFLPHWNEFGVAPGEDVSAHPVMADFVAPSPPSPVLCVKAPDGSLVSGGRPWVDIWRDGTTVPLAAPLGLWEGYTDAACTDPNPTQGRVSADVDAAWAAPGQDVAGHAVHVTFSDAAALPAVLCIQDPRGSAVGPGAVPWLTFWRDGTAQVPPATPFGVWAGYTDAGCTAGPTYARVALRDGTITDYPLYGLRLVVWFGA